MVTALLPLGYWIGTRLPDAGRLGLYLAAVVAPQAIWLYWVAPDSDPLAVFAVLFAAMMCVYELGYLINDHWAQGRERAAGLVVRKSDPAPLGALQWMVAVGLRALVVAGVLTFLALRPVPVAPVAIYLSGLFLVFLAHNALIGRWRMGSFFLLYLIRLQLPVLVIHVLPVQVSGAAVVGWAAFALVQSGAYSLCYGMKKGYVPAPPFVVRMGGVEFPIMMTAGIILPVSAGLALLASAGLVHRDLPVTVLLPTLHVLSVWILWSTGRYVNEIRRGSRRAKTVLSHCHTDFSHDASIGVADYRDWLAEDAQRQAYITDHAEDFDRETYARLQARFGALRPRLVLGLEYSIARQHVLAHGLRNYVDLEGLSQDQAVAVLREHSERLVWAHPRFALRKLSSARYWTDHLGLMAAVDAIEFRNPKNATRRRFAAMMHAAAWLACAIYGSRPLYVGVDAHHPDELRS